MLLQAKNPLLRRSSAGITFLAGNGNSVTNGGTLSVSLSGFGLAQNDIVVAFCHTTGGTVATPSGYTLIQNDANINGTVNQGGAFYKIQTATPDTTVSFWDSGGTSDAATGFAIAFRGVDLVTPLDVTATEAEGTNTSAGPPSITPSSNNCAIVAFTGCNHNAAPTQPPSGYNTFTNSHQLGNDTNDSSSGGAYLILAGGAGVAEDPGSFNFGSGSGSADAYSVTIALRPAT